MRIATFNCNSVRMRIDAILAWCSAHKPDVLALQETKVEDHLFPRAAIEAAGYHLAFRGMKSYNGVAILSREPPQDVRFGLDDGGQADEPRLVRATIGGITYVNTYVPQGRALDHEMFQYKLKWLGRLRGYFDRHFKASDHVVWLGDCNVAAEPIDVHSPETHEDHVCYHIDARNAFAGCRAWGFDDAFRKFHPEPGQYTFYDYRTAFTGTLQGGWRIDYIHTSPSLAGLMKDSWIDLQPRLQPKPSDHTFLVADVDF